MTAKRLTPKRSNKELREIICRAIGIDSLAKAPPRKTAAKERQEKQRGAAA